MGGELWRGELRIEPCRVELVGEAEDVRARASSRRHEVAVEGDSSSLTIESSREGGNLTLRVVGRSGGDRGEIEVWLPPACSAELSTDSGKVVVDGGSELLSYSVSTVTGPIEAIVDPRSNTLVELATSGEITIDFSIHIDYRYHQEPSKHGRVIVGGDAGSGTNRVLLTSRQGAVSVLRPTETTD